jgi:hypothetical protein
MADGATINLAAGTFAWTNLVTCTGKTLTITGAGKGATVLDRGVGVPLSSLPAWDRGETARVRSQWTTAMWSRQFFKLGTGCTLILNGLSMRNGQHNHGGAIWLTPGSKLDARDVEFKDNTGSDVRHFRAAAPATTRAPRTAAPATTRAPRTAAPAA